MSTPSTREAAFELKSAQLTLVALLLRDANPSRLAAALQHQYGDSPDFFDHDGLVIDLAPLDPPDQVVDFPALIALLKAQRLQPLAVRGGSAAQQAAARAAGLAQTPELDQAVFLGMVDGLSTAPVPTDPPVAAPAALPAVVAEPALVVDRPLRSGQQVVARGRDLVVLAMVNAGAEVIADGHIHVYAPLRGKAIAGARGNTQARIFATCLEAELLAIAGTYRTSEVPLPAAVAGKAATVRLVDGKLVMDPLGA